MIRCPVCDSARLRRRARYSASLPLGADRSIETNVHCCRSCGVHFREIASDFEVLNHRFESAQYTSPASEQCFRRNRIEFFRYLLQVTHELIGSKESMKVLDVGCSYGHLLDVFREQGGFETYGVEISQRLWDKLARSPHTVYHDISEVPLEARFDVITLIDVLYYLQEPQPLLRILRRLLQPDGLLVVRVTNRAWIGNLASFLHLPVPQIGIQGALISYTRKSLNMILERTGFEVVRTVTAERGKIHANWKTRAYYRTTELITALRIATVTPGLLVLCRPRELGS